MITLRGFHYESHFITSQGGYILQAVRIVNPYLNSEERKKLKPVLLHHGYLCSGSAWIIASAGRLKEDGTYWEDKVHNKDPKAVGNTLGFVLATSGYDVWLLNARGSIYSTNHSHLSVDENEFWQFGLDEIIKYDLPAVIEYVRKVTNRKTVAYIGHSQGTAMMYGLLATQPRFNDIVKPFIALAPVAYFTKMKTSSRWMVPYRDNLLWLRPRAFGFGTFRKIGVPWLCTNSWLLDNFCYGFITRTGSTDAQIDRRRIAVYLDNGLLGSSTRNFVHLLQQRRGLTHYDFGEAQLNLKAYGTEKPPVYDFTQITNLNLVEIHVKNDRYVDLDNIRLLKDDIKVPFAGEVEIEDESWGHVDLVWGINAGKEVNSKILNFLAKLAD